MDSGAPKLLLVVTSNKRRGAEVLGERLAAGLSDMGWLVEAVSLTRSRDSSTVNVEPLTEIDPAAQGRFSRSIVRALRQRLTSFSPDVVLANGGSTLRYGALATLGRPTPLAYTAIGESSYWIRSGLSRTANRALLRRTATIIAVSQRTMDQLVELDGTLAGRVSVVRPGLPETTLDTPPSENSGPLRLVQVGSLSSEKDPALALEAVAQVPDVMLRFVGSGPLEAGLAERADELDLTDRVEFFGSVDDVFPHFFWADALLLTSKTEGLPGVVLEAAATSTPTLGVDVGGVGEAIENGVTGLVVDRNVGSLVGAIASLDRVDLREMGDAARVRVETDFALKDTIRRYSEILSGLI